VQRSNRLIIQTRRSSKCTTDILTILRSVVPDTGKSQCSGLCVDLTHVSSQLSVRLARQTTAAATMLGIYLKKVPLSSIQSLTTKNNYLVS